MGGEPWFHVAPYQSDIPAALEALRRRVFAEGEYRGSEAEPASIEEALENMVRRLPSRTRAIGDLRQTRQALRRATGTDA